MQPGARGQAQRCVRFSSEPCQIKPANCFCRDFSIPDDRKDVVTRAIGTWAFSAHDFNDDELLLAAVASLSRQDSCSSSAPIGTYAFAEQLLTFLLATRKAYNFFVKYHNFRHACDVLQAVFYFLLQIRALPPVMHGDAISDPPSTCLGQVLQPIHTFSLIVSALGHDVGHPGVNNLFLETMGAPLALLYNDRSILESFHCAAYSQILRRYWAAVAADKACRKLMINIILATDMSHHNQYMSKLAALDEIVASRDPASIFDEKHVQERRELLCCLLIKGADICNVVSPPANSMASWC
ncbi:hypothetical protein MRB53_039728 [Persea americana]|nr:hypothetical protein MRB53_039728 [Persea americana]